ncbi:polysaccharide biosynthesis tyrosine autokinase [Vannielia litorea]|uniref:polysaccharide biosynthesis tyrosine autokinase n=1 Tax=Vannielia litorea TaxID=1217970 RepID=UPI001C9592CB|nr:polysaccharide biosynthesis tyrosine autokinase [Vannielia litorea]MBY6046481.1 polysaccharide biosynthesis tyrosine autokinase [Vannielia litorea]MBY6073894.1 polysaccharide biosynthesis tyrosine autokinase [Vannielia litorea]
MHQDKGISGANAGEQNQAIHPREDDVIDLGVLLASLWRGKWIIAIFAVLGILAGGYYAYVAAVPIYRATSVVMLETDQQSVVDIESVVSGLSADTVTINSEIEVMKSRSLAGRVSDRLDLEQNPEFNSSLREPSAFALLKSKIRPLILGERPTVERSDAERAERQRNRVIDALLERVSVSNVVNSLVFRIQASAEDPAVAAAIADTLADLYILNQLEVKFDATQKATSWLTGRVGELRVELEAAEARLAEFSANTELVSAVSLRAMERQLKELRDRISLSEESIITQEARLERLVAAVGREAQAAAAADDQLRRFLPQVSGDATIADAFDTRFAQLVERARLDLNRSTQQVTTLRQSAADLAARIESQSADLIALQQLQREAEASRALYEYFLGRLKETSAQEGIQQADSRILSNAVIPQLPSEPRKTRILALSALLGLVLGAGLVLLREARNRSFRSSAELEAATGLSVLGQIPRIPVRSRAKLLAYLRAKPTSSTAESFRNLRTSVLLSNVDAPPKVILSTSSIPGEGKTTNALALAQNLVGMGKKVLLIEGDIRRRTLHQYFEAGPGEGLVSLIAGEATKEQAIYEPEGMGLHVLMGEKTSVNAADLFSSNKFRDLIDDLRADFDAIVIDTPPVLIVPDARIISQQVDAVLFTVKWDSTSPDQVLEALRLFRQGDQKITGLILSQINPRGMRRYGYGGRYGAYGGYGSKYYAN